MISLSCWFGSRRPGCRMGSSTFWERRPAATASSAGMESTSPKNANSQGVISALHLRPCMRMPKPEDIASGCILGRPPTPNHIHALLSVEISPAYLDLTAYLR